MQEITGQGGPANAGRALLGFASPSRKDRVSALTGDDPCRKRLRAKGRGLLAAQQASPGRLRCLPRLRGVARGQQRASTRRSATPAAVSGLGPRRRRRHRPRVSPIERRVLDDDRGSDRPISTTLRHLPRCRGTTARHDRRQRHHRGGTGQGTGTDVAMKLSSWSGSLTGALRSQA